MTHDNKTVAPAPIDFSKWRPLPVLLMAVGGLGAAVGFFTNRPQFGYSWLQSFMFFLSLCAGGWFLVLVHHLFDASWSVPIRRINEQLACVLPWLALVFIPIIILRKDIYPWLGMLARGESDHALHSKAPLFSDMGFLIVTALWITIDLDNPRAGLMQLSDAPLKNLRFAGEAPTDSVRGGDGSPEKPAGNPR